MTGESFNDTNRIRDLNDAFRRSFVGGVVVLTAGVDAMTADQSCEASGRSTPSMKTTTRRASTTLAPSRRATARSSGKLTISTKQWNCVRPTPPIPQ
jgi:hypothetical protein